MTKKIKLGLAMFMLVFACVVAVPQLHLGKKELPKTAAISINTESELKSQGSDESDMDQVEKPAYFNLFKFIVSFLPGNRSDKKIAF